MSDFDNLGLIRLSENGTPEQWIKCFPEGSYKHPKGTLRFNETFHRNMVSAINTRVRGVDPVVDTGHDRRDANGWVKEARYVPGHGTDVRVDWTPLGEERIKNKIFRYVSPEYGPYENPATGEKAPVALIALSLENVPFLKNLPDLGLLKLSESGAEMGIEVVLSETATKKNPDPDDDGDDDSTAEGDTDHDYTGPDGKRKPKKKPKTQAADNGDQMAEVPYETYALAAENLTKADRDAIPEEDYAGPHHSFPVRNQHEATAAWDLAGHADDPDAVRARIRAVAKRKGFTLPDTASKDRTTMAENAETNNTTTATSATETVALSDAVRRLGEIERENVRLREEFASAQRQLAEERIESQMRLLTEPHDIELTGDDGVTAKGRTNGLAPVVLTEARSIISEHFELAEPVVKLLRLFQESGAVPLGELGVSRSNDERDPVVLAQGKDDIEGAAWVDRAKTFATTTYKKPWTQLSEEERLGSFKMTERRK